MTIATGFCRCHAPGRRGHGRLAGAGDVDGAGGDVMAVTGRAPVMFPYDVDVTVDDRVAAFEYAGRLPLADPGRPREMFALAQEALTAPGRFTEAEVAAARRVVLAGAYAGRGWPGAGWLGSVEVASLLAAALDAGTVAG